jgi:hypothetical protein
MTAKKLILFLFAIWIAQIVCGPVTAGELRQEQMVSFIYFTGIGCPHCANTDPVLLEKVIREENLLIIEYEIYRENINAPLMVNYNDKHGTSFAIPMLIAGRQTGVTAKSEAIVGDRPILKDLPELIKKYRGNDIILPNSAVSFEKLSLADLPLKPKIWYQDRVAVKDDLESKASENIKTFIMHGTEPEECMTSEKDEVVLSDYKVKFEKACSYKGWTLMSD